MKRKILDSLGNTGTIKFEITSKDLEDFASEVANKTIDALNLNKTSTQNAELIPRKEAMKLLGIKSPTTIINWEKDGKIKAYRKYGRKVYYDRNDFNPQSINLTTATTLIYSSNSTN